VGRFRLPAHGPSSQAVWDLSGKREAGSGKRVTGTGNGQRVTENGKRITDYG
jgi:hypothetical protein